MRARRQPREQRVRAREGELVPAHVRDLERGVARRDRHDLALDPVEPPCGLELAPARRHQLHAYTDAEERLPAPLHGVFERFFHARDRQQPAAAIGEGADAGQHDAVGLGKTPRIAGDQDAVVAPGLARRALQRLRRRTQIAGAVIDHRDQRHHRLPPSTPFVDGTSSARRGSMATACRSARARPL